MKGHHWQPARLAQLLNAASNDVPVTKQVGNTTPYLFESTGCE
jgi:hypothetical protein